MRTFAILILLISSIQVLAQRECAAYMYTENKKSANAAFARRTNDIEHFIQQQAFKIPSSVSGAGSTQKGSNVIRIPVVVHILYNTPDQNITDEQVKSQIEALNRDFRKQNIDTINIPERFKPFATDVEIEFVLATADPVGRPTSGIVRKKTAVTGWKMDDKIKYNAQGGDDAWDTKSYLNIWVGSMIRLLGYASSPGDDEKADGIVMNPSAFGTINTGSPYNMGRTAVHEVGHWLGLKHIWGDDACGDDLVGDTPQQGGFTSGCPSGFRSSCSNAPLGDMYMNYMDFTNDACLTMFTHGQKERMRALFQNGGPRNGLLYSKGLNEPWMQEAPIVLPEITDEVTPSKFLVYPNPAQGELVLSTEFDNSWLGKELQLTNMSGMVMQKITITSTKQKLNIAHLRSGIYFINGTNGMKRISQKLVKL